jgi:3-oxoacyl-[acyl-carrier-protein] synthase-3
MAILSKISGTGSYLPEKILTNDDLSKMVDTSDEWIFQRVGIKQRHIADDSEVTSDLAANAAREALMNAINCCLQPPLRYKKR